MKFDTLADKLLRESSEKASKQEVQYKDTAKSRLCKDCKEFEPPSGCEDVVGRISPKGSCKLWEKK